MQLNGDGGSLVAVTHIVRCTEDCRAGRTGCGNDSEREASIGLGCVNQTAGMAPHGFEG